MKSTEEKREALRRLILDEVRAGRLTLEPSPYEDALVVRVLVTGHQISAAGLGRHWADGCPCNDPECPTRKLHRQHCKECS